MAYVNEDLKHSKWAKLAQSEGREAYLAYLEKRRLIHVRSWNLETNEKVAKLHLKQWKKCKQLIKELG